MWLILLIVILLFVFGGAGAYGYRGGAWYGAPGGLVGILLLILLIWLIMGHAYP